MTQPLHKTFYWVVRDAKLPNGGTLLHARLSRPINRLSIMRRVLRRVRRSIPHAYGVRETIFR